MNFKLSTAKHAYSATKYATEIKQLEEIGFTFRDIGFGYSICGDPEIEINTIEDLMKFVKKYGDIVLQAEQIIIYNDYLE